MAGPTSAIEALGLLDASNFSTSYLWLKSPMPSSISIIANWGITYGNQVLIGTKPSVPTITPDTYVQFGSLDMYPPQLRGYDKNKVYVAIEPHSSKHQVLYPDIPNVAGVIIYSKNANTTTTAPTTASATTGTEIVPMPDSLKQDNYYCYALEILMDIRRTNSGEFLNYQGNGAFSMAYNPNANNTGAYTAYASGNIKYPTVEGFVNKEDLANNYIPTYLTGTLSAKNGTLKSDGTQTWALQIDLTTGNNIPKTFSIFQHEFESISAQDLGEKLPGVIKDITLPKGSQATQGVLTDIQVIPTVANLGRKDFINRYAFDYSTFVKNYML